MSITKEELQKLTKANLVEMAKEKGIEGSEEHSKAEIIDLLFDEQPDDEQPDDEQPADEHFVVDAMKLELAKRQSKFNTGINHEGKSSAGAFRAELARRTSKYGVSSAAPATEDEVNSAMQQELARRTALKR